jgi:polyphosphate kinase
MRLLNRELSWLSFNERVLQEALDETNPLIERMRFLGIYSNNMDEFFRVRVAYVRRMTMLENQSIQGFDGTASELFDEIRNVVLSQQRKLQVAYKKILKELEAEGIHHINEHELSKEQEEELREYFNLKLKHAIVPIMLNKHTPFPRLKDSGIYLAVKMEWDDKQKKRFALIKIPSAFQRFYRMSKDDQEYVILIDDIIRLNMDTIFSIFTYDRVQAFTFKFSRDAELDLDDDLTVSFIEKIKKSIKKRKKGEPVRFVYDEKMPHDLLEYLLKELNLEYGVNTIPGGKYHNFKDFMSFPDFGRKDFSFSKRSPNKHPGLEHQRSLIKTIQKKDVMLHFPYQPFDYVVDLLREAAIDPKVKAIKINVYRVAKSSQVMNALMIAVQNGKQVFVVLELQARFDEENNLYWSKKLEEAGAMVSYGVEGLKVHSKLIQIYRVGSKGEQWITYVGTGNFNESTAKIYEDFGMMTASKSIGREVQRVFDILMGYRNNLQFEQLFVSPYNTREKFSALIHQEIEHVKNGKEGLIRIKINNLVDADMIELFYKASNAGVKVQLVVRGICCLVPGIEGQSKNIEVRCIVGRYLEHSRFMIFNNDGDSQYILTSADWMERNLDKRIEVGAPVKDPDLQNDLSRVFETLWKGNTKSRLIDVKQSNRYYRDDNPPFIAQDELYNYYKKNAKKELTLE